MRRDAQRGQALLELVVSVPLFVFALLALLTVIAIGVQSERVWQALRYNGLVAQQFDPYSNYSLYELYENAGTTSIITPQCVSPTDPTVPGGSGILNGTNPLPGSNNQPFWNPASSPTGSCVSSGPTGFSAATYGLYADLLLEHDQTTLKTSAWGPLNSLFSSAVSMTASANFFRSPSIPLVLGCYTVINSMVLQATQPATSPTATGAPAALTGITPAPITPFGAAASCL
jgi:type II secretory pathway pseudopilin PulG